MGKNAKRRREAKGKKAKRMYTTLEQHHRVKKRLVPPLNRLPAEMKFSRWVDERLPEMLWACLVHAILPRGEALAVFRQVALIAREFVDAPASVHELLPTHSNLATRHPQLIPQIVQLIVQKPLGYAALRPLIALESLPGREDWQKATGLEPDPGELNVLAEAIPDFLDHQSEQSTDVRWLLMLFSWLTKKVVLPTTMEERIKEVWDFPNRGDLRKVRPFIRSGEQMLWIPPGDTDPLFPWSAQFWTECHERTHCIIVGPEPMNKSEPPSSEIGPVVVEALNGLSKHWINTSKTTAVDTVHEGMFAFVLYALTCLLEMLGRNRSRVAGRLLLRTITECRITLAFLRHKNDPALWAKFRRYGVGQAKLILLKLKEAERPPHSISIETLERLANEDVWQEFVDIDLGSWAGVDLRKMAEESGTKDVYDAHYGWNSGFAHGHWAALRDVTLTTCLNPLHRVHRVPTGTDRDLGDVVPDAIEIVEAMIDDLLRAYPGAEISLRKQVTIEATADQTVSPETAKVTGSDSESGT